MQVLDQAVGLVRDFLPLGLDEIRAIHAKTELGTNKREFEHNKSADSSNSTAKNRTLGSVFGSSVYFLRWFL